ncbi:hypothetical protein A4A49_37911 [Nicotiana attenuata]|uniref:Uncharacterized protein n=1 Tax=Nicotiana attenuata TaxID=49451 RepID=A0A1J6KA85_NICAT|nr:hypothetical protein A4A49_37911 [Nicotiana attenuata]
MEVQKRKCLPDGEIEVKKQIKTEKNHGKSTAAAEAVEDDEVEEFYAILKRIRVAVKYFEKGNADSSDARRKLTVGSPPWNLAFRTEDFKEVDGVKKEEEKVEDNAGLDLNADPVIDPKSEPD